MNALAPEPGPAQADTRASSARLLSIDILRGLAILWVIVFHLWGDMTYHLDNQASLFLEPVRDHVIDGKPIPALTGIGEALLSQGALGVPVFMMLSGLSLTLNAYRRGEPPALRGYWIRMRRLIPVLWAGIALTLATVAVIAYLQHMLDGGSFTSEWWNVRISLVAPIKIGWSDVGWSVPVVTWAFRNKSATAPIGSLWFAVVLLSYYLIFPLALRLERRLGPWWFAGAAVALTIALRAAYLPWAFDVFSVMYAVRNFAAFAPLRFSEFAIGMSLGHLLATRDEEMNNWVSSGIDTAGIAILGLGFLLTGLLLDPQSDAQLAFAVPLQHVGLALLMVPLLFKRPGRLEHSLPARALIAIGVVSLTALIVNDNMRFVASFLRYEGVTGVPWWLFLTVVYVPVGTLLAYPLARLFRLLPSQRMPSEAADGLSVAGSGMPSRRRKEKRRAARAAKPARI